MNPVRETFWPFLLSCHRMIRSSQPATDRDGLWQTVTTADDQMDHSVLLSLVVHCLGFPHKAALVATTNGPSLKDVMSDVHRDTPAKRARCSEISEISSSNAAAGHTRFNE